MRKETRGWAAVFIALLCLPAGAQPGPAQPGDEAALSAATQSLCPRQAVMLGESATHGDGHTVAFKVALIERLVDECGFDSVFFEASHYEFIHVNQRLRERQDVTAADISAAVGGLWEFDLEFQPLSTFLAARAKAGRVFLGGLDDQLGEYGQDYANVEMVRELTGLHPQPEGQACGAALHKRIYSDYPDASPYSRSDRAQIETCLTKMQQANAADTGSDQRERTERQEMISAAQRWINRDFSSDAEYMVGRDRSMYQDFEWLLRRKPRRHKVIVWAATVHIAKQGDPSWGERTGTNFGSFVRNRFGHRAFTLGFAALAGSYRQPGGKVSAMPAAPPDSVESKAVGENGSQATYVGPAQLAAMGTAPGALFRHSYQTLPWSNYLDGVVVFREEHPPGRIPRK